MNLKKSDLLTAIAAIGTVATKRTSLPVLNSFLIHAADGEFHLRATDLETDATIILPCEGELAPMCVQASWLRDIAGMASETIEFKALENRRLKIDAGFSVTVVVLDADEFPPLPAVGKALGVPVADVADCILAVAALADDDPLLRQWTSVIRVECAPKLILAEGGNTSNLARCSKALISAKGGFMLPCRMAGMFAAALKSEGAVLHLSDNHASVIHKHGLLYCRLYEGVNFPDMDRLFDNESEAVGVLTAENATALSALLKFAASIEYKNLLTPADLTFGGDGLRVKMRNPLIDMDRLLPGKFIAHEFRAAPKPTLKNLALLGAGNIAVGRLTGMDVLKLQAGDLTILCTGMRKD